LSVFEQNAPKTPQAEQPRPQFHRVVRGYDPLQVDRYVMQLITLVEQQHRRAEEAEQATRQLQGELEAMRGEQPAPSFVHLGAEAARILEQAGKSAERLLAEAKERAREIVQAAEEDGAERIKEAEERCAELELDARHTLEEAEAQRDEMLTEAAEHAEQTRTRVDGEARAVLAEARDASDLVWQELQQDRAVVEAETDRLRAFRENMLEHFEQIHGALRDLLEDAEEEDEVVAQSEARSAEARAAAANAVMARAAAQQARAAASAPGPAGDQADDDADDDSRADDAGDDDAGAATQQLELTQPAPGQAAGAGGPAPDEAEATPSTGQQGNRR
jgi:cell division septum initiation protein DivIVA